MSKTIAIAGKGGVGKSTVTALILKAFLEEKKGPVLLVDADPAGSLNMYLDLPPGKTIADIMDGLREQTPPGMSKPDYFRLRASEVVEEYDGFDFLPMGHPEGKGCYCSVNNMLREFLASLRKNYPLVLIDNEAGLEHLSRKTNDKIDVMLFVAIPTLPGLAAVREGTRIAEKLKLVVGKKYLLFNQAEAIPEALIKKAALPEDIEIIGNLKNDAEIAAIAETGGSILKIGKANPAYTEIKKISGKLS